MASSASDPLALLNPPHTPETLEGQDSIRESRHETRHGVLEVRWEKGAKGQGFAGWGLLRADSPGYERWGGGQSNQRAPGAEALRPVHSNCSKHLKTYGRLTWPESVSN